MAFKKIVTQEDIDLNPELEGLLGQEIEIPEPLVNSEDEEDSAPDDDHGGAHPPTGPR